MSLFDDTLFRLNMMGITPVKFRCDEQQFNRLCGIHFENMRLRMLNLINFWEDEPVPRGLERWVMNWTMAEVIKDLRVKYPAECTFIKYISEGTDTRQFALRDPSKEMDPVVALSQIPWDEIYSYRRLVRGRRRNVRR